MSAKKSAAILVGSVSIFLVSGWPSLLVKLKGRVWLGLVRFVLDAQVESLTVGVKRAAGILLCVWLKRWTDQLQPTHCSMAPGYGLTFEEAVFANSSASLLAGVGCE